MTQLAVAVDSTDELWTLDDLPTPEAPYVEVEDELIEVRSRFPSSYYTLTGETLPPRIRVRRGIAGTTKASHIQGSTLTPNYGLGSGGGGGAIAVDNTVDAPVDVTGIVAVGASFDGTVATLRGKDFYAQDTDPGAVGYGAVWKDTVTSDFWERNPANDGWTAAFEPHVTAVGDDDAAMLPVATAPGNGNAVAGSKAVTEGTGYADAQSNAEASGGGDAYAGTNAIAVDGAANVSPSAVTSGSGAASISPLAQATGSGDSTVVAQAIANTGSAFAGSTATRQGVTAGMEAEVDGTSARMAFNGTTPIAKPTGVAVTAEGIHAALVSLGLIAA